MKKPDAKQKKGPPRGRDHRAFPKGKALVTSRQDHFECTGAFKEGWKENGQCAC